MTKLCYVAQCSEHFRSPQSPHKKQLPTNKQEFQKIVKNAGSYWGSNKNFALAKIVYTSAKLC